MHDAAAFAPAHWHGGAVRGAGARARLPGARASRRRGPQRLVVRCARVLVLNCASGGHAFLGAHLSEALLGAGHSVTLLQDGAAPGAAPCLRYPALAAAHASSFSVTFGAPSSSALDGAFDAVYDNFSKSTGDASVALAAGRAGAEVFYVSSAGAYASAGPGLVPSLVGDPVVGPTVDVEGALRSAGVCAASFRPIYLFGAGSAKRAYLDFFFDRMTRGRPVYIPGTGAELTSLTDVRDVAAMLAAALGRGLRDETFNAVSPRTVTFDGVAQLVASVVGCDCIVRHYDPDWAARIVPGFSVKKVFPFRARHFFADPAEARRKLGWEPQYSGSVRDMLGSIGEAFEEYKELGLHEKDVKFEMDEAIAKALS